MPASTEHASTAPLSSSEALLWTIERDPALRSTIMAVAVLDGAVDVDRLHDRVLQAVDDFPRLRQRVTRGRRGLRWTDAPDWEVDQHITHLRLPPHGTVRHVLDFASEQAGEAFDPARPLWHLTLLDGDDDCTALVVKIHHSMTDGVGGIGLVSLFTDPRPNTSPHAERVARATTPRRQRPNAISTVAAVVESAVADPVGALHTAPQIVRSTAKILAPATRSLSPVTTGRGLDRHLDLIDVPLRSLERAGHCVGGTVNDAFMAAVVGGLRRYHAALGAAPSALRVTMPISVRSVGDGTGGNRFTPARFTVPLDIDDPAARMLELGAIARRWKREPAVGMTDLLAGVLTRLPEPVTVSLFGSMLKGVDFVASNVPGTRERRWLAGAEVLQFYGFAPPSGSAMSITLVSHVGTCCVGVNADRAAVADADLLRSSLEAGFAEVVALGGRRRKPHRPTPSVEAAPAAKAPNRLSALDATFLEAETDTTPMHIGAMLLLDGDPLRDEQGHLRLDDIRAAIEQRLPRSPRMRQVVVSVPFARPVWEDDPTFDINEHVHHVRVPKPGTSAELERLCCDLQMRVLDRDKPLWEMWFVDGLVDGRVGLVYKVHHAVVDGVSAADSFEVLLTGDSEAAPHRGRGDAGSTRAQRLLAGVVDETRTALRLSADMWAGMATHPIATAATALAIGGLARPSSRAPHTTLNLPVGDRRRLVAVRFDLAALKSVGRHHEATVNDVLLTLVGAGLDAVLTNRHDVVDHVQVLVPISLRGAGGHDGMGNRVTGVMLPLPLGRDPVSALRLIAAETRSLKRSPQAAALDVMSRTFDAWPIAVVGPASRQTVRRQPFVNLVVTNVRGPQEPLRLLGAEVVEITPVVPLGPNLRLGVAALSYAGTLTVGLYADADAFADIELVADGMKEALTRLQHER
jgi:WS/DGAT/MGAT family acyltransferase